MNTQDTKRLINNVIKNEFNHIQQTREYNELLANTEINECSKRADDLLVRLHEVAPEHIELIDNFEGEFASYWIYVCEYYFKKGVVAGTTNLNFLENTNIMTYI